MKKLLQINTTANWGSTGKIAEDIGKIAIDEGWLSWIAYGRGNPNSKSQLIRIGDNKDILFHGLQTRLLDNHGLASKSATCNFIKTIDDIQPDIIHLHNVHGYYINYKILFDYLRIWGGPVVWTLHDCWSFTGHCSHYSFLSCNRWKRECHHCPQINRYPRSFICDRSAANFKDKLEAFTSLKNLTLVPVSNWLRWQLTESFLRNIPTLTIHNGIDITTFHPIQFSKKSNTKIILGVASVWDDRKGLYEFYKLRELLPIDYRIILVGLTEKQISELPNGIEGITRTDSIEQLVGLYNCAEVFVNPTFEDTFPTTNLESLACGTPVITYNTGGAPETVDAKSGFVVDYGDINMLAKKIQVTCTITPFSSEYCRNRAVEFFDKTKNFQCYLSLYNSLLNP